MGTRRAIYVETLIHADLEDLWSRTQRPDAHRRWDLRFTEIDHLPGAGEGPQRFRYAFRLPFGRAIAGEGVTAGDRHRPDGSATSALRFGSADPRSPIAAGSGYWRYVPTGAGIRFLTGYDYRPGWGGVADRLVRPLMGWATAWSFDRLRLWLETGRTPERSLRQAVAELVVRGSAVVAATFLAWSLLRAAPDLLPTSAPVTPATTVTMAVPAATSAPATSAMPAAIAAPATTVMTAVPAATVTAAAVVTIVTAALAAVLPPLPGTPAARRCLRRPPARVPKVPPGSTARPRTPPGSTARSQTPPGSTARPKAPPGSTAPASHEVAVR